MYRKKIEIRESKSKNEKEKDEDKEGKKMLKVIYQMCGIYVVEFMYPAEYKLFRLTKPDYMRIRHTEKT